MQIAPLRIDDTPEFKQKLTRINDLTVHALQSHELSRSEYDRGFANALIEVVALLLGRKARPLGINDVPYGDGE